MSLQKREGKAELIFARKQALDSGLLVERKIWREPKSANYPLGVKYRLVLAEPKEHAIILLYDNHHPKGPHVHWDGREREYDFKSVEILLNDFFQESAVEERRFYENKKNHY